MNRCSPKCLFCFFLSFIFFFTLVHIINNKDKLLSIASDRVVNQPLLYNSTNLPKSSTSDVDIKTYSKLLHRYSSKDNWILMTLIDQGCLDMAINFYETSLKKFGIQNYLFIGSDRETCSGVTVHGINCYVYKIDKDAGKSSVYLSKDFLRKMNIRTYMILDALKLGYNILHTDVDMTFLKNPFEDMDYLSTTYDVAPLWDCGAYNAGFLFIRNTLASREVYSISKKIADTQSKTDDQTALNRAISKSKKTHGLKVQVLSKKKYLCGKAFFEDTRRSFVDDKPCSSCVVVHHNWIVSMEAKAYRMKEMHMWMYDVNQYYSHPNRKYLYYDNPVKFKSPESTKKEEINALMNAVAIGALLNRTVIYPKFHCGKNGTPCTLLHYILLRQLTDNYPNYRESTFLQHPKLANGLANSLSKKYIISSHNIQNLNVTGLTLLKPKDLKRGATAEEIITWFSGNKESILQFHSLYNAFCCYSDKEKDMSFQKKIKGSFKTAGYRQFNKK